MPGIPISIYLNEEEYGEYIKDKENLNNKARNVIKTIIATRLKEKGGKQK